MANTQYTVSQAPVLASVYLDVQLPVNMEELKKAFRKQTKKLHPDNQETGNARKFLEVKDVYEFLVNISHLPGIIGDMKPNGDMSKPVDHYVTTDGTSIFDLGLGLGVTKNGRDCPRCEHKGYTVSFLFGYIACKACDENGSKLIETKTTCRHCTGTGKFKQKNSGRIVDCLTCKGTGKFTLRTPTVCSACGGRKRVYGQTEMKRYERCFECGGTGEIEIHNPVIFKGRIF
jgi:molecular chaperone DnaJ